MLLLLTTTDNGRGCVKALAYDSRILPTQGSRPVLDPGAMLAEVARQLTT